MPPETPLILAFDTSAAHCAAALLRGDTVLASRAEDMARGQAERLMPMLEDLLAAQGCVWADLAAIGVGTGPGNFTGTRISVAAARGLALALDIPAIGVSGFEVLSWRAKGAHVAVIPAPRGQVYIRAQDAQGAPQEPALIPEADLAGHIPPHHRLDTVPPAERVARIARIAASCRDADAPRPAPLYLRPADAAPSRVAPPVLLP